jgi:hypothetical protein
MFHPPSGPSADSNARFLNSSKQGALKLTTTIVCLAAVIETGQLAHVQPKLDARDQPAAKRINVENLITAAPLPDGYEIERRDIKEGDKLLGHKLTLTKDGAVSKVIVSIDRQKIATREEKVTAAKTYIYGIIQSFRAAGLKPVEKEIPEIDDHDFKKRVTANLVYKDPANGSRFMVQIQIFFSDLGHTVLVVSDNEEDHAVLTKWARSVRGK